MLATREQVSPEEFTAILAERELHSAAPIRGTSGLRDGSWYLKGVDELGHRAYARK